MLVRSTSSLLLAAVLGPGAALHRPRVSAERARPGGGDSEPLATGLILIVRQIDGCARRSGRNHRLAHEPRSSFSIVLRACGDSGEPRGRRTRRRPLPRNSSATERRHGFYWGGSLLLRDCLGSFAIKMKIKRTPTLSWLQQTGVCSHLSDFNESC